MQKRCPKVPGWIFQIQLLPAALSKYKAAIRLGKDFTQGSGID